MAGGRIDYTVGFKVDSTQLNSLKTQLQQLSMNVNQLYANNAGKSIINTQKFNTDVNQVKTSITELEGALTRAFNTQLGSLNITKFNQELKGLNLSKIQSDMASLGPQGQNAFRSIAAAALSTNMQLKQSHTFLRSMADTMANTLKWGVASSAMNTFAGSVKKAYGYVKELDKSLNDIRIVTKSSAEDMELFAKQANKAAKELHASTTAYTEAALIYYQQGLSEKEVEARTNVTMKVANVTGVDAAEASEYLTAVWNGYKVSAQETELYVDKLAKVAASTASNLEELSTGMSKVASAANLMGVDVDQLNAQLSTIISVTREAPETVGTSLKTIYARMGDIEAGLDEETTLGEYTEKMAELGFNVLDANDKIRDMGEVVEEIGGKWNTLTREQQLSLANTMAGQRQYSRLLSLFDNWDKYTYALEQSKNATGELQSQQDIYADSIKAHLADLQAATQGVYASLMDADGLNPLIDSLTVIVELFDNFVQVIGGGAGTLQLLGMIAMKVFNQHIINGLTTTIMNMKTAKYNAEQLAAELKVLEQYELAANNGQDERLKHIVSMKKQILEYGKSITAEDRQTLNQMIQQTEELYKQKDALTERQNQGSKFLDRRTVGAGESPHNLKTEKGIENAQDSVKVAKGQIELQTQQHNEFINALNREKQAYLDVTTSETSLTQAKEKSIAATQTYITQLRKSASAGQMDDEFKEKSILLMQTLEDQIKVYNQLKTEEAAINKEATRVMQERQKALEAGLPTEKYDLQLKELSIKQTEMHSKLTNQYSSIQVNVNQLREQSTAGLNREKQALDETDKSLKTLYADLIANKQGLENAQNSFDNFLSATKLKASLTNMMGIVQGLSSLTMGITSMGNAWNALKNPDLSTWEKFSQIMMGLSMGLSMVTVAYKQLIAHSTIFAGISTLIKTLIVGQTTEQALLNLSQEWGMKIKAKATAAETAEYLVKKRYLQLLKEEAALRGTNIAGLDAETKARLKNQATQEVKIGGKKGGRGEALKNAKTNIGNWFKTNGKLIKSFALIAAGIAVVTAGIKIADKFYNKEKYAAEEAAEASKRANEEFSKARESYDSFKDSISKYSEATSALNELEKGTVEYKEKVLEANEAALKLIQTIEGLSYSINSETGLIELNEAAWERAQEAQLKKLESAQAYAAFANQRSQEAQLEYEQTQFNRKKLDGEGWSEEDTGAAIGYGSSAVGGTLVGLGAGFGTMALATKIGGAVGTAITPGIGTAIGVAAGLIVGAIGTAITALSNPEGDSTDEETNAMQELAEAYKQKGSSVLTPSEMERILSKNNYSKDLIESLKNLDSIELEKQIQAIVANTEALERNSQVIAGSANTNNNNKYYSELKTEKEKGLADKIIADKRSKATSEQVEEAREKAEDLFGGGFLGINSDQDAYDEYLKFRYGDDAKNYRVEDQGGTNATLQKKNEDGTWETIGGKDTLSNDEVIDFLQEQYLLQMTGTDQESLEKIMEAGNKIDAIKGVDDDEVLAIQESLAMGDNADLSVLSPEQVAELEKQMNEIGALLGEDYAEALQKGIDNYDEALYMKHINEQYQQALSDVAQELEVDKDTLEMYTDAIIGNNEALAENSKIAVEAAKQQIAFAQGTEDLQSALEDNLDILREWNEDAFETYEAAAEVQDALEKMFDVKVSADFIHENLEKIEKAAEGDVEAIEELSLLAAQDYTASLNIDKDRLSDVNSLLEQLANTEIGIGVTTDIDTSNGIKALNELLASGAITQEQMEKMFSSIGYKPEVKMVTVKGKPTTTTQTHKIDGPGFIDYEYTDTITSQTDVTVPQIADEDIDVGDIKVGEGTAGSFTQTTTSQNRANAQGSLGNKDIKSKAQENAEKMKYLDEERDIYHDINIELQKLESNLEKVQKAREKMVGGDIIDSLDKELGLLDKQIAAQKTKLEIAKLESQTLKENLSGQGVQFAEDGTIINYNAILEAKEAEINGLIKQYKNASENEQKTIQEKIDKKQEDYDKFKENLERYDEVTFSELAELENEVSEAISQKIELNIEKFTKDINLKVNLNEFKKEWRELQQNILFGDDDNFASFQTAVEGLQDTFGEDGGLLTDQLERTQLFLQEYDKIVNGETSNIFEDSAAAALEAAREMHEMSMESAQQALEYINTIKDAIDAAFEQIMGLHDSILDTFDYTLTVIEHQIAVKELLFGNNANIEEETVNKFETQLLKIEANRAKIEDAENRSSMILKGRSANELEDSELYNWMEQQVEISEAYEEIFSSVEEALETINTLLQQDIQNNLKEIETELTHNVGWDRLSERWEKDQELADVYLSGINKEYELQKLLNKINQDLLDKQYDSINAQKKINDFKNDELAILMQKDKLTQAELDRANKLYELTLLQIALDEARNNKTSMKLTRDSQGNYVYQYAADEDAISKAEQDLADKRNEIYNQNVEDTTKAISDFNSLGKEMQDEIQGVFDNDKFQEYLGLIASGEGDTERGKELEAWLYGTIDEITSDYNYRMGAAQDNAISSLGYIFKDLGIDNVDFNNLTDEQRQILLDEGINMQRLEALLEFDEKVLSQTLTDLDTDIQSMIDTYVNRVERVTTAAGNAEELTDYYTTLDLIKVNTEELRNIYRKERDEQWKEFNEMSKVLQEDISDIEEDLKSLIREESGLLAKNNKAITGILSENTDSISSKIDKAISAIGEVKTAMSGFVGDLNIMKKQIQDNITDINAQIVETKTSQQKQSGQSVITDDSTQTYYTNKGQKISVSYDKEKKQYTLNHNMGIYTQGTYSESDFAKLGLYTTAPNTFKEKERVKYNGKDTYNVVKTEANGLVKINDYLNAKDSDILVSPYSLEKTGYMWKDLRNTDVGQVAWEANGYDYWLIAASSNGKAIFEHAGGKKKGQREWCDPYNGQAAQWTSNYFRDSLGVNYKKEIKFNTGGYTGQWFNGSKDGRLAWLHQKELILNEKDTPKILDAVKLVREISAGSVIANFEAQMKNTLASLENQLIGTYANIDNMAAATKQSTDQMLEQAVHIDATFPGVKDAKEIEEALNNLVNVASQYAYENNK